MAKSETIESLEELGLSGRTKAYLKSRHSSLDEIIWAGRINYYYSKTNDYVLSKPIAELVEALEREHLVRDDIDMSSFSVNRLISATKSRSNSPSHLRPCCLEDLVNKFDEIDYKQANKRYEEFENPKPDEIADVKAIVQSFLSKREYEVILLRFNLKDGPRDLKNIGELYDISKERVVHIEAKALRKLRHRL